MTTRPASAIDIDAVSRAVGQAVVAKARQTNTPVIVWNHQTEAIMELHPDVCDSIDNHRTWLADFDPRYLERWERHHRDEFCAAMIEATTTEILRFNGVTVEPNESLTKKASKSVDFQCSKSSHSFFVEATSLEDEAVIRRTKVSPSDQGPSWFSSLERNILAKFRSKKEQIAATGTTTLLAIGTADSFGSTVAFDRSFLGRYFANALSSDIEVQDYLKTCAATLFICPYGNSIKSRPHARGVIHSVSKPKFLRELLPDVDWGILRPLTDQNKSPIRWFTPE